MRRLRTYVVAIWNKRGILATTLWVLFVPISFLYSLIIRFRNGLFALRLLPRRDLPCAVVSVGNLTVGGTGKTPLTLWLAKGLQEHGYEVAILSRGYGRKRKEPYLLEPGWDRELFLAGDGIPLEVGDEPAMMARLFAQRVGVGKDRYKVGTRLINEAKADVVLLDDGFQHRRLHRDLDLLILGSADGRWTLPAGPFREPTGSLCRADICLITASREKWEPKIIRCRKGVPIFLGSLKPQSLLTLDGEDWKERPLSLLSGSKVVAVSGIAHPSYFYRMIHDWEGDIVEAIEFPDHHYYSSRDWQRINREARNAEMIITTEKDMLKLVRFPFAKGKLLALRVGMAVENGTALIQAVVEAIRAKNIEDE